MNAIEAKNKVIQKLKSFFLSQPNFVRSGKRILFRTPSGKYLRVDFQNGEANSKINSYFFINIWKDTYNHDRIHFEQNGKFYSSISIITEDKIESVDLYEPYFFANDEGISQAIKLAKDSIIKSDLFRDNAGRSTGIWLGGQPIEL